MPFVIIVSFFYARTLRIKDIKEIFQLTELGHKSEILTVQSKYYWEATEDIH